MSNPTGQQIATTLGLSLTALLRLTSNPHEIGLTMTENVNGPPSKPDFSAIPDNAIRELHRQGELCLLGTVQLALAADQRATTLSGILGAGAVALAAATAGLISGGHPNIVLIAPAATTALFLFVGALLCAWSAQPTEFFIGGYEPRYLAVSCTDEVHPLRYAAEDLQMRIDANRGTLERAAVRQTWGRRVAAAAVPAGVIIFFIMFASSGHHSFS
jgi:hypothetical protein